MHISDLKFFLSSKERAAPGLLAPLGGRAARSVALGGVSTLGVFLAMPCMAWAQAMDMGGLRQEAQAWLARQVEQAYPDAVSRVEIGPVDSRLRMADCENPRFFLSTGARLWGGGSLGMKCLAPATWTLYLTYQVQLTGPALTALHPIPARQLLGPGDATLSQVRYEHDPGSYLREIPPGAVTQRSMNRNQPILVQDLILPDVIQAGAKVRVRVQGKGFSVTQEGKALNTAKAGGTVQVKMPTGRIVRGMANQAGEVEIRP